MDQLNNEQPKARWPRIDVGHARKPNMYTGTGSLPMNELFRESHAWLKSQAETAKTPRTQPMERLAPQEAPAEAASVSHPTGALAAPPSSRAILPPSSASSPQVVKSRAPKADCELRERRAVSLPGWCAVLAAGFCLAGAGSVLLWLTGQLPASMADRLREPPEPSALPWGPVTVGLLALCGILAILCLAGLIRVRSGTAVVSHAYGRYRATLRHTGLRWQNPLRLQRVVDVRIRHWRSRLDEVADRDGTPLDAVLLVIWQIHNTARVLYAVDDHEAYLKEQFEAVAARVFSTLPCDSLGGREPSLRNGHHLAGELTQALAAEVRALGIEVYSVQVVRLEYAAHVAEVMRQRRLGALEAKHREGTLDEVAQAVEATTRKLTTQGGVEWDDYERKAFVRELTVAFYAARTSAVLPANAATQPQ
ncbi:SPFH domain-containing protein [Streptomyces sp. NPDC056149]|uniref:SPFH domain-containing protein n=1 Tax=unclassified Streptomyces TaxID=2593676 RepID=UPI002381882C|nr:SPFH domain-containing protein [Streptomyces sp. WZ-12]